MNREQTCTSSSSELNVESELPEEAESEANQVIVDILGGEELVHLVEHGLEVLSDEDRPSGDELRDETIVIGEDESQLRDIDVEVAVFVSGSSVVEDLGGGIDDQVPQLPVLEDPLGITGEDINLSGELEGGLEAIVGGGEISVLRKGQDEAVPEGGGVVSVDNNLTNLHPLLVTVGLDETVDGAERVMDTIIAEGTKALALMTAASSSNDGFMVELVGDRVDQADETVAVLELELTVHVSHEVTGCLSDVSGLGRLMKFQLAIEQLLPYYYLPRS